MRLEGKIKMGYYPTPDITLSLLKGWLTIPSAGTYWRALDPCCGTGDALAQLAPGADTYGIELATVRAEEAEGVLNHVLPSAYEYARLTRGTYSFILLNPPYDGETMVGSGKRMEETFLVDLPTTEVLVPGGVLAYIIPHKQINERIARHLTRWYENLMCFLLPEEEYKVFGQVIILGTRRADYVPPTNVKLAEVEAWADGKAITKWTPTTNEKGKEELVPTFRPLGHFGKATLQRYEIPPSPEKGTNGAAFRFQYVAFTEEALQKEAEACAIDLDASTAWLDRVPSLEPAILEPAMTPKKGHIALQLSGGLLGTNLVHDPDGTAVLLKGHISKTWETPGGQELEPATEREDGRAGFVSIKQQQKFVMHLTTLTEDGTYTTTTRPDETQAILDKYIEELAQIMAERNKALYDLNPQDWEWDVFTPLSSGRQLPGREECGLTPFQKHLAIANGRELLRDGASIVNAEMGSGKTTIGLAIAEYLDAHQGCGSPYPALITGPGIVTGAENWPKEIAEVIPGAHSVVIDTGAKPIAKPAKIGAYLKLKGLTLDEAEYMGRNAKRCLQAIQMAAREQGVSLSTDILAALTQSLKDAERRPPNRRRQATAPNLLDARIGGYLWMGLEIPRDEENAAELARRQSLAGFMTDYANGLLPRKSFAICSFEAAKLGAGRVPAMPTRYREVTVIDPYTERKTTQVQQVLVCPRCGELVLDTLIQGEDEFDRVAPEEAGKWVGARNRFCSHPAPRRIFNPETNQHDLCPSDEHGHFLFCDSALFQYSALRRMSVADVARRYRGKIGLAIVDEIHKAKAKGTGNGYALQRIQNGARWTLGLTGTLFGGYSTSVFWLLYRLAAQVREQFAFNDEQRWAEKFGLLKRVIIASEKEAEKIMAGTYTGTIHVADVDERPGVSPAIAGVGLRYCTYSSLADVGLPLPHYMEEIVRLDLTKKQWEHYHDKVCLDFAHPHYDSLLAWAQDAMESDESRGALGAWLTAALNRTATMFRDDDIQYRYRRIQRGSRYPVMVQEHVMDLESPLQPGELLPKEAWLAERVAQERAEGRKTIVYVRQSGTNDIQPRLKEILESRGLRVAVLKSTVAPAKRGPWIRAHQHEFDVLIANPRLVEVGLNLTMLASAIFYELDTSLYTLWQAMRRLYRPGAPLPVRVLFPVYNDTMEERMLDLIGLKMRAAQVFYGDAVGGALVDEADNGDDLVSALLSGALSGISVGRAEGNGGVFASMLASTNAPIAPETVIVPVTPPTLVAALPAQTSEVTTSTVVGDLVLQTSIRRAKRRVTVADGQLTLF